MTVATAMTLLRFRFVTSSPLRLLEVGYLFFVHSCCLLSACWRCWLFFRHSSLTLHRFLFFFVVLQLVVPFFSCSSVDCPSFLLFKLVFCFCFHCPSFN